MLDALKNLKYLGGKEGLLFFFCDVVGTRQVSVSDAEIICSHLHGKQNLSVEEIAAMLGYSNSSNFYKAFREYYHQSPREFAK